MMKMQTNCTRENGVNGNGSSSECASHNKVVGGEQPTSSRYQATASLKGNKVMCTMVMKRFFKSEPSKRGNGNRMI